MYLSLEKVQLKKNSLSKPHLTHMSTLTAQKEEYPDNIRNRFNPEPKSMPEILSEFRMLVLLEF